MIYSSNQTISKPQLVKCISANLENIRWGIQEKQSTIANKIGITQPQLSSYEHGEKLPSLETLIKLANCYDVSIDYLVGRCENRKAHKTQREIKFREM